MKNVILYGIQTTVDHTFSVGEDITKVAEEWEALDWSSLYDEKKDPEKRRDLAKAKAKIKATLQSVKTSGLSRDVSIRLDDANGDAVGFLKTARDKLCSKKYPEHLQLGGNPAISALRGWNLASGKKTDTFPHVEYVGLYHDSLANYIRDKANDEPGLVQVFKPQNCIKVRKKPITLSAESDKKLFMEYGPGRRVEDLGGGRGADFSGYIGNLKRIFDGIAGQQKEGKLIVALAVPFPIEKGGQLIDAIKASSLKEHVKIFVGVSSFRDGPSLTQDREERLRLIYDKILVKADIISCNELELHDLHTVLVGGGKYKDIQLALKLKELDLRAMKVCHSSEGAILEVGTDPDAIVTSKQFTEDPGKFLHETLQLATDGATYAMDSLKAGRSANDSMVRTYSSTIKERADQTFRTTFLRTLERMPGGIVAVQAPLVAKPLAAVTGAGAMFDGLFLSYLMRTEIAARG